MHFVGGVDVRLRLEDLEHDCYESAPDGDVNAGGHGVERLDLHAEVAQKIPLVYDGARAVPDDTGLQGDANLPEAQGAATGARVPVAVALHLNLHRLLPGRHASDEAQALVVAHIQEPRPRYSGPGGGVPDADAGVREVERAAGVCGPMGHCGVPNRVVGLGGHLLLVGLHVPPRAEHVCPRRAPPQRHTRVHDVDEEVAGIDVDFSGENVRQRAHRNAGGRNPRVPGLNGVVDKIAVYQPLFEKELPKLLVYAQTDHPALHHAFALRRRLPGFACEVRGVLLTPPDAQIHVHLVRSLG
eukprot:2907546-Rhodomonas_salina.1